MHQQNNLKTNIIDINRVIRNTNNKLTEYSEMVIIYYVNKLLQKKYNIQTL